MSGMVGGCFVNLTGANDRMVGGPAYRETIAEMDIELTKVIEDFGRAVDVEALRLAQRSGKQSLSQSDNILFSMVSCRASRARASGARPLAQAA
jgi:hypothetical protein